MPRLVVLVAFAVVFATLCPPTTAGENGVFDESFLFGDYFSADLFALRDGEGVQAWGFRSFNGFGVVASVVNFASRTPLAYEVTPTGAVSFTQGNFNAGQSGTVALNGAVALWTPYFNANADSQVPEGYGAIRIASLPQSGASDSDFEGDYSQHGIVFDGLNWWNLFGGADADGAGNLLVFRDGSLALSQSYDVASNGAVDFVGTNNGLAALTDGGDLLFQSADIRANTDADLPGGYEGLLVYLRRSPPDKGLDATSFRGRYRVHELRVRPLGNVEVNVGEVEAGGAGLFFGSLDGQAFDGELSIFPSGVFSMSNDPDAVGTLGANGDFAVVTRDGGQVSGGSGEVWMQIWARTAGGAGNDLDADGDGLSDADENAFNTNASNPDTDGDGIIDGLDDNPRTADNIFTAVLNETELTITEGESPDDALTLTLDSNDFPFFSWAVSPDQSWAGVDTESGIGDTTITITLDTSGLAASETPYEVAFNINAPAMAAVTAPVLSVTIQADPLPLQLDPAALQFEAMQGSLNPPSQSVALSAIDASTDFDWISESSDNWLSASPASGSGPDNIDIAVNIAGLLAEDSPFSGTISFREDTPGAPTAALTVTLLLAPPREVGVSFEPTPSSVAQGRPAVGHDPATDRYTLAWEESGNVRAMVMDGEGVPRLESVRLNLIPLGPARAPQVVVDTARSIAWMIWEQESLGGGDAFVSARTINLNTLAVGNVFGLVSELDQLLAPKARYNAVRDEIVVAATLETEGQFGARFYRIDPVTRNELSGEDIANLGDIDTIRRVTALAAAPDDGLYLTAWEEEVESFGNVSFTTSLQLVDAITGTVSGSPLVLPVNAAEAYPQLSFVQDESAWLVSTTRTDTSDNTLRLERRALDDLSLTTPARTQPLNSLQENPSAVVYNPLGEQLLWAYPDFAKGTGQSLAGERRTRGGFLFPDLETLSPDAADQTSAIYNPARNEFLVVWRAQTLLPQQINAVRLDGGSADEDEDTLPNDWEFEFNLDPFDATGQNGRDGNPDDDMLTNETEFMLGTDPRRADTDGDGLLDWQEDRNGDAVISDEETNPALSDTDMDGADDGAEWFLGTSGTDADDFPETGLYRIDYGNWFEGVATRVTVHAYVREAGEFTLALNSDSGITPPDGWAATLANGPATRTLARGSHVFAFDVIPEAPVTPANDHGVFTFTFSTDNVEKTTMTGVFVVDNRTTVSGKGVEELSLAEQFAPIIRLHRSDPTVPIDIDTVLAESRLDRGNTRPLGAAPTLAFDLFQSPQADAALDLPGTTLPALRDALPPLEERVPPMVYFTATALGDISAEAGPPENHIALQYYIYFAADGWGENRVGGHRHEGDWEAIQILLDADRNPYRVTTTQQWQLAEDDGTSGGASLDWEKVERLDCSHPMLYAGSGSHALYFRAGTTDYASGIDDHDGLGTWYAPANEEFFLASTDYDPLQPYLLSPLPRLTESGTLPWQRFAGRWGQLEYPSLKIDAPTPNTDDGPVGPAFLGVPDTPSIWTDPWAWASRMPATADERLTTIEGTFNDTAVQGENVILLDAKGRIYRTPILFGAQLFRFENVPRQHYTLSLATTDAYGADEFIATARYDTFAGTTLLIPAVASGRIVLGSFDVIGNRLAGAPIYSTNDTDNDNTVDRDDIDQDGDGFQNNVDDDDLGDGFNDTYQQQDADGDGVPRYFDADDDNDDLPDTEDDDADGNGVLDAEEPQDTDGDGIVDTADLDIDNDGFLNTTEETAGTNPANFFDSPTRPIGDIDGDGDLDSADLQQLVNRVLGRNAFHPRGDFDIDGRNTAADIETAVRTILDAL